MAIAVSTDTTEVQFTHDYNENTAIATGKAGNIMPNPGIKFNKVPLKLDIETLDVLISYTCNTTSKSITRSALNNLFNMINMINMNLYRNNQSLRARIELIQLILEARLHMGFDNRKLLLNYALERSDYKEMIREEILPEIQRTKINERSIQYMNSFVAEKLIYGYMYAYKDEMFRIFEDLESNNYRTMKDITTKFKELVVNIMFDIRRSEDFAENNMTLDLSSSFESVIAAIVTQLKDPTNKLISGVKALNMLLNGGFEQGRSYMFFGITGIGKSLLLLNILIQIKLFNKVSPKDPSKRPAVLYISQENSVPETVERMFNIQVTGDNIRNYTPSEVSKLLRSKGGLTLKNDDDIDIIVKYYEDKEISTLDLEPIIKDIEDTGREVIVLIHDYVERIRSSKGHQELRLELAEIANDYSVIAKRLNIPVIGAGQFNRRADEMIETARATNGNLDIGKHLNKSHASESFAMFKNIDAGIGVHRVIDENGDQFMTFTDMKQRSKTGGNKKNAFSRYFAHPLDPNSGYSRLIPDIEMDEFLSRTSLSKDAENDVKKSRRVKKEGDLPAPKRETSVEIVDNDLTDFNALESVIKKRKPVKVGSHKPTIIEVDSYTRNESGYIKLTPAKKLVR